MAKEKDVVSAAKKLLKLFGPKGSRWVSGRSAVDVEDNWVPVKSRKAAKFCLGGAMEKLRIPSSVVEKFRLLVPQGQSIAGFNDSHRTYTHVRRFLEKVAGVRVGRKSLG